MADFHNTDGQSVNASVGGGPGSEETFEVEEGDKAFIEDGEDIVGMEVKFSHFDLITADNYLNSLFLHLHVGGVSFSGPPESERETIIFKDMIKLY